MFYSILKNQNNKKHSIFNTLFKWHDSHIRKGWVISSWKDPKSAFFFMPDSYLIMKTKIYTELEFTISPLFTEHVKPFIMCEPLFSNNFRMVDRFLTHGPLLTIWELGPTWIERSWIKAAKKPQHRRIGKQFLQMFLYLPKI